jgi:hypothetical protein
MSRSTLVGLLLIVAAVGCSKEGKADATKVTPRVPDVAGISDDELMKQWLAAQTKYVEAMEKKASSESVKELEQKSKELYQKFQALPSDRMGALMNKYMKEFDAVMERTNKAHMNQK